MNLNRICGSFFIIKIKIENDKIIYHDVREILDNGRTISYTGYL